mgnify:CR=1 FL=1
MPKSRRRYAGAEAVEVLPLRSQNVVTLGKDGTFADVESVCEGVQMQQASC